MILLMFGMKQKWWRKQYVLLSLHLFWNKWYLREQKLLNNVLLSAVFVDSRYKVLLDKTQIEKAKNHLKHVWIKMISLNNNEYLNENCENENSSSNSSVTSSTCNELENFLKFERTTIFSKFTFVIIQRIRFASFTTCCNRNWNIGCWAKET